MTKRTQTNPVDHIKNILANVSLTAKEILAQTISTDKENDVRCLFAKVYSTEVLSYYALLTAFAETEENIPFWKKLVQNEVDEKFIKDRFYFVLLSASSSIFLTAMIDYEVRLRCIMKDVWSDYDERKGMEDVYKKAISLCNLSSNYCDLNKILTYSRNTMHNGWVCRKPDAVVTYKSKTFTFKENYPIEISWSDLEFLIIELMSFWKEFVLSSPIKDKPFIEDYTVDALRLHNAKS